MVLRRTTGLPSASYYAFVALIVFDFMRAKDN